MVFWIIALTIALGVALILSRALAAGATRTISTEAYDLQVYRDQLAEVERDLARGVLGAEDGDRARTEISRKILAADRARRGDEQQAQPRRATAIVAALTGAVVMAGGFGLYLRIGGDGLTDQPMAARIAAAEAARATRLSQAEAEVRAAAEMPAPPAPDPQYARLMEELRAAMAARPDDIKGLRLLVSNEARLGNFSAAAAVQAQVITVRGTGADGEDHAALGELQVLAAGGYVTPEAEASFEASLARDRQNGTARFYLGIAAAQFGRPDQAFVIWRALLEQSPASAPWVPVIAEQIADLAWAAGVNYTPPTPRGPSAADIAAAQDMSAEDRAAMISSMVEGLSARLASEGGPATDWAQLIRALGILGETERARAIFGEAQVVFAEHPADLALIRDAAAQAGIGK